MTISFLQGRKRLLTAWGPFALEKLLLQTTPQTWLLQIDLYVDFLKSNDYLLGLTKTQKGSENPMFFIVNNALEKLEPPKKPGALHRVKCC